MWLPYSNVIALPPNLFFRTNGLQATPQHTGKPLKQHNNPPTRRLTSLPPHSLTPPTALTDTNQKAEM
jgi:hypothetical protein